MYDDFFDVLLKAKEQYFVLGNLLLLKISLLTNDFFCNKNILFLPKTLYWISVIFYAVALNMHFFVFKNFISNGKLLFISFCLIILSLHGSDYEVFSRASNVGFIFYYIALMVITFQATSISNKTNLFAGNIIILISIYTNPAVFFLLPLHAYNVFIHRKENIFSLYAAILTYFLSIGQVIHMMQNTQLSLSGAYGRLIEVIFARSILFPLIEPIYHGFNDFFSVAFTLILICLLIIIILNFSGSKKLKIIYFFLSYGLIIITLLSAYTRPFDTISGYLSSWPDRYFYIQNLIVILIVSTLALINIKAKFKIFMIIIVSIYIINSSISLYKYSGNKIMTYYPPLDLLIKERLFLSSGSDFITIPTYFVGWQDMKIPKTLTHLDGGKETITALKIFPINDDNWEYGVSNDFTGFLTYNLSVYRGLISDGNVEFVIDGKARKLQSIKEVGRFLYIVLEGEKLRGNLELREIEFMQRTLE